MNLHILSPNIGFDRPVLREVYGVNITESDMHSEFFLFRLLLVKSSGAKTF
jgi:hypothetical protein